MSNVSEWSVHAVHPYTYKMEGDCNIVGPIERYAQRDAILGNIFSTALERGMPLFNHWEAPIGFETMGTIAGLSMQSPLKPLLDERVIDIILTPSGIPFPDERFPNIPEDKWNAITKIYATRSSLREKLANTKNVLLLGGVYEACLGNFAAYFHEHYRSPGQRIVLVPELAASRDSVKFAETDLKLKALNAFDFLSTEQILDELGCRAVTSS